MARIGYFELQDALTLAVAGAEYFLKTARELFEKGELGEGVNDATGGIKT